MKQAEQAERRSDQNDRVEDKDADLDTDVTFLCAEENVWAITAAIIALLHLRVRNQIGDFLVHVNLLGGDGPFRILEEGMIERPLAIQNLIDHAQIAVESVR